MDALSQIAAAVAPAPWDEFAERKGFGSIKYYGAPGNEFWGEPDLQRDAIFDSAPAPLARILRSVGESTPLGLMSVQDGGTYGCFRFAGGTDRRFFGLVAKAPELANTKYAAYFLAAANSRPLPTIDSPGLREAWWVCSRQPWFLRLYFDQWARSILSSGVQAWRSLKWHSELGLALCVRARNSSGTQLGRVVAAAVAARSMGKGEAGQVDAGLKAYGSGSGTYARRVQELVKDHPRLPMNPPNIADVDTSAGPLLRPSGMGVQPYPTPGPPWGRLIFLLALLAAYSQRKKLMEIGKNGLRRIRLA